MTDTHLEIDTTQLSRCSVRPLNAVWTIACLAIAGAALCVGLLMAIPIVIAVCWFKFNLSCTGVLIVLGSIVLLVASATWLIGRSLFEQLRLLLRTFNTPELSPLSTHVSAALMLMCIS